MRQSTPLSSAADAVHDPVFSPQLIEAIRRSHDPSTRMPVIRSDRYDCIDLPRAPEGYAYTLRCHGRYVPLLAGAAVELSPHHADHDRAIPVGHEMFRITPNNVEGLGFIELVTHDATAYTGRAGAGHEHGAGQLSNFVDPVMCIPVFITPDAILASELSRTIGRFAQLGTLPRYSTSASPSTRRAMRPHRPPAARGAPTAAGTLRAGTRLTGGDWRRFASTRRPRAQRSDGPPRPRASSPPGIPCHVRRIRPCGTPSRWATRTGTRSRVRFRSRRRCRRAPTRRITPTAKSTDTRPPNRRTWTCTRTTRTLAATVACTAGPRVLISSRR